MPTTDPYTLTDQLLVEQLRTWPGLTSIIDAKRIIYPAVTGDISSFLLSPDQTPRLFVYPGRLPYSPFVHARANDRLRTYEIVYDGPGLSCQDVNRVFLEIERAVVQFAEFRDSGGDALVNPTPLRIGNVRFGGFEYVFRDDQSRVQIVGEVTIELSGTIDELLANEDAPTFRKIVIVNNVALDFARAILFFDQPMLPTAGADVVLSLRDGLGRAWTSDTPAYCVGGAIAVVTLGTATSPDAGASRINTYGGGAVKLSNVNEVPVADVYHLPIPITVIE